VSRLLGDPTAALPTFLPEVERRAVMPAGFAGGGLGAGIKRSGRPDLAIIRTTNGPAAAAAVFTPNAFAAAPVRLSPRASRGDRSPAGAVTAGQRRSSRRADARMRRPSRRRPRSGQVASCSPVRSNRRRGTLLLSTGVIGTRLPLDRVEAGIAALAPRLSAADEALESAASALMTTDSQVKVATTSVTLPDPDGLAVRTVTVSGIAKGVGMIHPRMATMLAIVLTDAAVEPTLLHRMLRSATARTWTSSVDGDTSTNDTVFLLASGASGSAAVVAGSEPAVVLGSAIEAVARDLARQQAADGEGATTLVMCQVTGAVDDPTARAVARAVVSSSLVKAAVHGRDPNWGRIAGAAGNAHLADASVLEAGGLAPEVAAARAGSPTAVDPDRIRIAIAGTVVFDGMVGGPVEFDRSAVRAAMDAPEVILWLDLGAGTGSGEASAATHRDVRHRELQYTT
jgi:glutamate N-acetyltransferase/amino-acid N-acetyltransferase